MVPLHVLTANQNGYFSYHQKYPEILTKNKYMIALGWGSDCFFLVGTLPLYPEWCIYCFYPYWLIPFALLVSKNEESEGAFIADVFQSSDFVLIVIST